MAYATIEDYEAITGQAVLTDQRVGVERSLAAASDLIALYLGEREPEIAELYESLLADLVVSRAHRLRLVPWGVRSEAVGGASVTYDNDAGRRLTLTEEEMRLLNLMLAGGRSSGIKGVIVGWGQDTTVTEGEGL